MCLVKDCLGLLPLVPLSITSSEVSGLAVVSRAGETIVLTIGSFMGDCRERSGSVRLHSARLGSLLRCCRTCKYMYLSRVPIHLAEVAESAPTCNLHFQGFLQSTSIPTSFASLGLVHIRGVPL